MHVVQLFVSDLYRSKQLLEMSQLAFCHFCFTFALAFNMNGVFLQIKT